MNQSIYLMLGVPYTMLLVIGFLIYRGVKKNEAYIQEQHRKNAGSKED